MNNSSHSNSYTNLSKDKKQLLVNESQQIHQIKCLYHKGQMIHNFCEQQQCLLPMCPLCVEIHSIQHQQCGTFPQFRSQQMKYLRLSQITTNIKNQIQMFCVKIQQLSKQYTKDYSSKQKMQVQCRKKILYIKNKVMKDIESIFAGISLKIEQQLSNFDSRMLERYNKIQQQVQYLYQSLKLQMQGLNESQSLLKTMIKHLSENKQQKIKEWINKIQIQINEIKKQSIKIVQKGLTNQIASIRQCISVQQFIDYNNEYLQTSARQFITSSRIINKINLQT